MMRDMREHPMQVLNPLYVAKFLEDVDKVRIEDLLFIIL